MEQIDEFKTELHELIKKYKACLYLEDENSTDGFHGVALKVDFQEAHSHTILIKNDNFDYIEEVEKCNDCGKVIESEAELENELCQSCLNEAIHNETAFQEGMTESYNI